MWGVAWGDFAQDKHKDGSGNRYVNTIFMIVKAVIKTKPLLLLFLFSNGLHYVLEKCTGPLQE